MKARTWYDKTKVEFNPQDICFILYKTWPECKTYFTNGEVYGFMRDDMLPILKEFSAVCCYELASTAYINKKHIVGMKPGQFYEVKFTNGEILKGLSGIDFEKNVILKRNTPNFDR